MAKERLRDTTNPLKAGGASKARTRYRADHLQPRGAITDKNSLIDRLLRPGDTAHPSQQGGATALHPSIRDGGIRKGHVVGTKRNERGG